MLIKLVPVAPQPTVLFSFSFPHLEDAGVDVTPAGWENQLSALHRDGLEVPKSLHALDKAAGITSLLDEVLFSVPALTITCRYQDGSVEEWPLMDQSCLETLDSVVADVAESAVGMRREKRQSDGVNGMAVGRAQERTREHDSTTYGHREQMLTINSLLAPPPPASSSMHAMELASPGPSVTSFAESPLPGMSSRALRRRARSRLVDAFRRYVLPVLSKSYPKEGYYCWVVDSMIRRANLRMDELMEREEASADHAASRSGVRRPFSLVSLRRLADDSDDETDTDSTSIRTPSATETFPLSRQASSSSTSSSCTYFSPRSEPETKLSPQELAEYTAFSALTAKLRKLSTSARNDQQLMGAERERQMSLLEGRSRRRAWLNMRLARSPSDTAELSKPYKSSRIAQQSWTSEDFEYAPDRDEDEEEDDDSFLESMGLATAEEFPRPPSRLFLPYDSDDDEEEADARSADIQRGLQLLGLATPASSRGWRSLLHDKPLSALAPPSYSEDLPDPYDDVDKDMSAIVQNVSIVGEREPWAGDTSFLDF